MRPTQGRAVRVTVLWRCTGADCAAPAHRLRVFWILAACCQSEMETRSALHFIQMRLVNLEKINFTDKECCVLILWMAAAVTDKAIIERQASVCSRKKQHKDNGSLI